MSSKFGLGIYTNKPQFVRVVRQWNPTVVLLFENGIQLAPAIKAACPDTITVGRWWLDPIQYVPLDPAEAYHHGKEVATALNIPAHPQVDIWQSYNEYINSGHSLDEWYAYSCFETGFTEVVHYWGKKSIVGNIAVGNGDVERLKQMREALSVADYLGYHAYTSREHPGLVDDYYFGRHKKWVEAYKQLGWRFPPIILTEVGTYYPWKHCESYPPGQCVELDPRPVFQSILEEMNTDNNVIGGCVFCLGDCGGWSGFNIEDEENIKPIDGGESMPLKEQFPDVHGAWVAAGGDDEESFRFYLMATKRLSVTEADYKTLGERIKSHVQELTDIGLLLNPTSP